MTVGYLILAHAHPEQVVRMMEALRAPGVTFAVHVDARSDDSTHAGILEYAAKRQDVHDRLERHCRRPSLSSRTLPFFVCSSMSVALRLNGASFPLSPISCLGVMVTKARGST